MGSIHGVDGAGHLEAPIFWCPWSIGGCHEGLSGTRNIAAGCLLRAFHLEEIPGIIGPASGGEVIR